MASRWKNFVLILNYLLSLILCMGNGFTRSSSYIDKDNRTSWNSNITITCSGTNEFERCFKILNPVKDSKFVHTNQQGIRKLCGMYYAAVDCVNLWAKHCTHNKMRNKKILESAFRGFENIQAFCKVSGLQQDDMRYRNCLKNIYRRWNQCTEQFFEGKKKLEDKNHHIYGICCIHIRFNRCANAIGNQFCPKEIELLLQSAKVVIIYERPSFNPLDCENVTDEFCKNVVRIPTASCANANSAYFYFFIIFGFYSFIKSFC